MTTTWATRLAADHGHDLRLYVKIQGISQIFQEDGTDVPSTLETSTRSRLKVITKIQQGESRLNLARRRMEGGSLTVTMIDDDSGTLRSLFAPRKYRKTFITPNSGNFESASDATINVKSTSWAASSGHFFVDGETITYTGKTATTFTGCTRGAFNSEAQKHFGGSTNGASVFDVPPAWLGRRVYLTGYFVEPDGTTTSALSQSLGVFRLESAPVHKGDDVWELKCSELSDEFWSRKIGSGLQEIQLPEDTNPRFNATDGTYDLVVGEGEAFNLFATDGLVTTHVLLRHGSDLFAAFELIGQKAASSDTIEMTARTGLVTPPFLDSVTVETSTGDEVAVPAGSYKTARHIAVLSGQASTIARRVLTSRLGDGTNGSDDDLPGAERDLFGGPSFRMGAGISTTEVDTASFNAVSVGDWQYVIDREHDLGDFLLEFCLHTGSIAYVTRSGQLAVKALASLANSTSLDIDDDIIVASEAITVQYDEEPVYPRIHLHCNYDPLSGEHCARLQILDSELQQRYPGREEALLLESRSIVIAGLPLGLIRSPGGVQHIVRATVTRAEVEDRLRGLQMADGRGRGFVSMACHLPVLAVQLGDAVALTATMPDLEANSSVTDKVCRVVAMRPRYDDGEVDVTLQILDEVYVIAPACVIAIAAGSVLTLQTTGAELNSTTPGRMFADGPRIEMVDVSAGTTSLVQTASHTDTTVTVDGALPFVVQNGVDWIRVAPQGNASTTESQTGFDGFDYIYQMPDDENDSTVAEVTRWRGDG